MVVYYGLEWRNEKEFRERKGRVSSPRERRQRGMNGEEDPHSRFIYFFLMQYALLE